MTTMAPVGAGTAGRPMPTLLSLARADALRFAKHPLFLLALAPLVIMMGADVFRHHVGGAEPTEGTLVIAFFPGVFGFVVAHRLTTALRRSGELADTAPVGQRQRTAALCLACLVPAAAGTVAIAFMILSGALWPPVGVPANAHVVWFGDEPDLVMLAVLIATGPVAALGGPLLGVAVARWAPFRGSALLGMVVLVVGTSLPSASATPWRVLSPWAVLVDEKVVNGKIVATSFVDGVRPAWYLGFTLCLCGLAAVAALLRDPVNRRPLIWVGAGLVLAAVGCFMLTLS